ncbi:hypothetical protein SLS58_009466 [Diplodia intermedia]|uniref:Zn(2)-C6 fungal-type domain-containing protein n=1 Tax=Diplodia intermedia TaxID=856260 RepID=A0ABR3TC93_9PEZI
MFSTLKNSTDAEGTYVLEPTRPPFDSKRQGKLARVACTHCRAKKLKCSGDSNGCTRCLSKNIECRYPTTGSAAASTERSRSTPSATASPPGNSAPPAENGVPATTDNDVDALMNLDHPSTALFLESLDAPHVGADFMDTTSATIQWPFDDLFPLQDLHAVQPAGQANDSQQLPFSFPTAPDSASNRTQQHQDQQRKQACNGLDLCCCDCIKEAIQTYESIQVDLVVLTSPGSPASASSGQAQQQCGTLCDCHNTAGLIDVLQHQKAALGSCKALVGCPRCREQSAYVMFAISMCGALLESIEHLHQLVSPGDDLSPPPPQPKAPRRAANQMLSPARSRKSSVVAHGSLPGSDDSLDGFPFARQHQQHRRGVQIGRWKLDDDDERHVIQGLLSARMVTLGRVIDGIERAVDDNQWLTHENAVRRLREPFSLASLRIKQQSSSTESLESR